MATAVGSLDERVARKGLLDRLVARPELGSVLGALAVLFFFSVLTERFLTRSAWPPGWTTRPP